MGLRARGSFRKLVYLVFRFMFWGLGLLGCINKVRILYTIHTCGFRFYTQDIIRVLPCRLGIVPSEGSSSIWYLQNPIVWVLGLSDCLKLLYASGVKGKSDCHVKGLASGLRPWLGL